MDWKRELKILAGVAAVFLAFFYLPVGRPRFDNAVMESLYLTRDYAREHVILCLVPALFIAGAISIFVSQASVMKYLGAGANKVLAYGVASVSGSVLAVCSCTVLPLFAGIYQMGAGLGPATTFLYAGPAINVLAIMLSARVLGLELGVARAAGAVVFSIVIGLLMHLIFRKEETEKARIAAAMPAPPAARPLWQNGAYFASMVSVLVFANWGAPQGTTGLWREIHSVKWLVAASAAAILAIALARWFGIRWWKLAAAGAATAGAAAVAPSMPLVAFSVGIAAIAVVLATEKGEARDWLEATWEYAKLVLPLLFAGIVVAGLLLGRPGHEGLIPSEWVSRAVGGNSLRANFFASVAGAFMYFATLTEVPIVQGLLGSGMGKGPALALLLAGPALSLPSMLVLRGIMGTRKTLVFVALVVVMATTSGVVYGIIAG